MSLPSSLSISVLTAIFQMDLD